MNESNQKDLPDIRPWFDNPSDIYEELPPINEEMAYD